MCAIPGSVSHSFLPSPPIHHPGKFKVCKVQQKPSERKSVLELSHPLLSCLILPLHIPDICASLLSDAFKRYLLKISFSTLVILHGTGTVQSTWSAILLEVKKKKKRAVLSLRVQLQLFKIFFSHCHIYSPLVIYVFIKYLLRWL